ncbi:ATP synthase F(0) complex subunit k, mitochondrial-like [Dermacentor variabilis]|uniref:ATP synthase F(0) complex subunit k, mitochondrial-like n=1 Tax=Dermacentor variabilis TaxID=34621 RepID=UPI003F5AEC3C
MAGANEPQFQGLSKYFNTVTQTGRANIAKATYLVFGTIGLYYWAKKKPSGGSAK